MQKAAVAGVVAWLLCTAASAWGQQEFTSSPFVGPPGGTGLDDGVGTDARLSPAGGIAFDVEGNAYVADPTTHTIRRVTPAGSVTTLAGKAGERGSADGQGGSARFNFPEGLVTDTAGNFYVADELNHTIRKITPSGFVSTIAGRPGEAGSTDGVGGAARFENPEGLAIDHQGNMYVADSGRQHGQTIRRISMPTASVTTLAGAAGQTGFADGQGGAARFDFLDEVGCTVDTAGNLYVTDNNNSAIRRITPSGAVTTLASSTEGVESEHRVLYDAGRNQLWLGGYGAIKTVSLSGAVTTVAGTSYEYFPRCDDGTGTTAHFYYVDGLGLDAAGNLYVADSGCTALRRMTGTYAVITIAGHPAPPGSADGVGAGARLYRPQQIGGTVSGHLYIADRLGQTIRSITPAGDVTTLAGLAGYAGFVDGTGASARFRTPEGIFVDTAGNVLVADRTNKAIRRVSPSGDVTTLVSNPQSPPLGSLSGVVDDPAGNVFFSDASRHTVRRRDTAGNVTVFAGADGQAGSSDGVGGSARFNGPAGLGIDASGNVYVADRANHTIRRITPIGVVSTVAGLAGEPAAKDGAGSDARFRFPVALAVGPGDELYVADLGNHLIREVAPSGSVRTILGRPDCFASVEGTGSDACIEGPYGVHRGSSGVLYFSEFERIRRVDLNAPAPPDTPVIDSPVGPVGETRMLDVSPSSGTAWEWKMFRKPFPSTATLSSTTARNPTFTPDVADLFMFRATITDASGRKAIRTVAFQGTGPNGVTNPGFTAGVSGWTAMGPASLAWSPLDSGGDGSGSALITDPGVSRGLGAGELTGSGIVQECIAVLASARYSASARMLVPSAPGATGGGVLAITWYGDAGCQSVLGSSLSTPVRTLDAWGTGVMTDIAPPSGTIRARVGVSVSRDSTEGTFQLNVDGVTFGASGVVLGDLNVDGTVDVFDIVTHASYIVGNASPGVAPFLGLVSAAELNRDGRIDVLDLVLLQAHIVGNVRVLPQ